MFNLVCFPHYTAGGLLCDLLNHTHTPVVNGTKNNLAHRLGKIGDSVSVFDRYDVDKLMSQIQQLPHAPDWIGTHCWPGQLDSSRFGQIISITTATYRSKMYRWMRACRLYHAANWQHLHDIDLIDAMRECAKNYLQPFRPVSGANITNLEFSEVVEHSHEFLRLVPDADAAVMQEWRQCNSFLYDDSIWNSLEMQVSHQAEFEIMLDRCYMYH